MPVPACVGAQPGLNDGRSPPAVQHAGARQGLNHHFRGAAAQPGRRCSQASTMAVAGRRHPATPPGNLNRVGEPQGGLNSARARRRALQTHPTRQAFSHLRGQLDAHRAEYDPQPLPLPAAVPGPSAVPSRAFPRAPPSPVAQPARLPARLPVGDAAVGFPGNPEGRGPGTEAMGPHRPRGGALPRPGVSQRPVFRREVGGGGAGAGAPCAAKLASSSSRSEVSGGLVPWLRLLNGFEGRSAERASAWAFCLAAAGRGRRVFFAALLTELSRTEGP